MGLAVKVRLKDAERVRKILQRKRVYNPDFLVKKEKDFVYFPVQKKVKGFVVVKVDLKPRNVVARPEELLAKVLSPKELMFLPRAYDVVGDILILELPGELKRKEKVIAEAYLKAHPSVKTVVRKSEIHGGVYRTRRVSVLAGKRKKETIYKESGLRFKVHLEKMYFSSRLVGERLRIARKVKKGEEVLVMFSGAAPYCCVIARHGKAKMVYGVEINPAAHEYAKGNIELNKLENRIKLFKGDVGKVLPRLKRRFDRIVMPLPKTGEKFLPLALKYVKKGGVIHYYNFLEEVKIKTEGVGRVKDICRKEKKRCRIMRSVKAGQHAPYVWRVCFDIKIL